ncbi:MAG: hypothetical protein HFJ17_03890 [Clostridia bacterium]|nr:hypothetical protein [Clostridia bacterium]
MKLSKTGLGTIKLNNIDEMYPAQSILLQSGQLVQYGAGIFAYNNIPLLVKRKVEEIIQKTLNKYDCIEVSLPILQPEKIWKDSGRYDTYVNEGTMLTVDSNKGTFCLAPTAEEAMLEFAREKLKSYKNLPATFYQIGDKCRNEIRTRGYLLRGKMFTMLDAYSFGKNEEEMKEEYQNLKQAFLEIFKQLELPVMPIAADSGAIGGKKSEEFMVISPMGEDKILIDKETGIGLNTEVLEKENHEEYLREYGITDISNLEEIRTVELGHIFQLETKYSEMMNGKYINQDGKEDLYYMGCFGIGVSRTVATIYEHNVIKDKDGKPCGFALPKGVAPYKLQIIPKMENEEKVALANKIYNTLNEKGIECILDDREKISIGAKMKDCKVLGTPYMIVLGDKLEGENVELEEIKTGERKVVTVEELINILS